MKKLVVAIFLLGCISIGAQTRDKLKINIDLAQFQYDETANIVEFYYSFPRSVLLFDSTDAGYKASVLMRVIIEKEGGEAKAKMWRVPLVVADTTNMSSKLMIGKVDFLLEPGTYEFSVLARDENNPALFDSLSFKVKFDKYHLLRHGLSDIELCSSIKSVESDSANIFCKNTLEVIPNPTLVYGIDLPRLLYYIEMYNIKENPIIISANVVNGYGKSVVSQERQRPSGHQAMVEVGALNVRKLPSDIYTLIVSISDTAGKTLISRTKKFYIYNPDIKPDSTHMFAEARAIDPVYADLAEDELDELFNMTQYISTKTEKEQFKELKGAEAKRKFMTEFWRRRDPTPDTPRNEYKEEYMKRVDEANKQFRTAYRRGYLSDQGRVYILYGPPSAIDRTAAGSDTRPYQTWTYDNLQGGVVFIFVDRTGFANYELVHSTLREEIHDPNWQRYIRTDF
ncbi:MAG: GWxTD domain-containing protein [Chlorobi bacterium]|nr:GWxTD domain-containing protein [Chlorobiota bacterium]